MLSLIVFLPLAAALLLVAVPRLPDAVARWAWVGVTLVDLTLVGAVWAAYEAPPAGVLAFEERARWIPGVGSSYHVGVDGLSLPLVALTAVLFAACAIYALRERDRPRVQAALFLFLQSMCLGLFVAADLIVFFVFFDLSIVGMYFAIAGWGHGDAARSALKFFLYTFLGSLSLLLGFIGLYVAADPHTFDMAELAAAMPLADSPLAGGLVLAAVLVGLAVKTPTVPFHTWLPPAHTDAPAIGSAVLAGVLLKMGTYGFVRIAMPMLPGAWRAWAWVIIVVGVVSVLYGALVALAQTDVKRMIAYTSVNHMGYVVLAVGAAGVIAGSSYDMGAYGGLAAPAPRFATLFAVGAFASLGLPGFSGFIAEFQVFAGSIAAAPLTALALPGILVTAALFLRALQRLFAGETRGRSVRFADLRAAELWSVAPLLLLALVIGVLPRPLLDVIEPAAAAVVDLLGR